MQAILDILGKVGFDWQMALFNFINFLLVFFIIKHFAFEPTMKIIAERKEKAKDAVDNFEKAKTELAMAEQKAQNHIDEAKVEANKVVERAADEARQVTDKMKEKAKVEIELLVTQAKKNIEIDRAEMQEQLREQTVDLVIATSQKILGNSIDTKADQKVVKELIEKAT